MNRRCPVGQGPLRSWISQPPPTWVLLLFIAGLAACTDANFYTEGDGGSDPGSDGVVANCDDADGDGIGDEEEGKAKKIDTDGDGTPDYLDTDSDNDGIKDKDEALSPRCAQPADHDSDGIPNYRDKDSDGNGIKDSEEGTDDLDNDTVPNFADQDDDGDTILDDQEIGKDPLRPIDTDADGKPDYRDTDSDGDGIGDIYEGTNDLDADGSPNFRDADSDGDGISDSDEKGKGYPPPQDTDKDKTPDYLDTDSDNDGLSDKDEVSKYKTDPTKADTDGDGVNDMVETLDPAYDPLDPKKNPKASGDFVFTMEYNKDPSPKQDTLDFSTDISQADIFFAVDTTGSMSGEISNLSSSLNNIVNTIKAAIPSTAFGVARYEDFPTGTYGGFSDVPFGLLHRVMTVATSAGLSSVTAKVNALGPASGGSDGPESGWEAMYQTATGKGVNVGGANVPAFNAATAYPATPPTGESVGSIGGAGFRTGSMPIIIWASDAASHDPAGYSPYSFSGAASSTTAVSELSKIGAKVIGVMSQGGYAATQAISDLRKTAETTGATVSPSAFGAVGFRPTTCALTQCCTGLNGVGQAPNSSGLCPLVYTISDSGQGLGNTVIDGIKTLISYGKIDINATAIDDATDTVDAVMSFIQSLAVHNVTSTSPQCTGSLTVADVSPAGDGINDTFKQVQPATPVCFDVTAKKNTTIKPTAVPQLFQATIQVLGDGKAKLSERKVFFVVPPEIPSIPTPN